jgi:F-type H+-transporting ATPase subunit b
LKRIPRVLSILILAGFVVTPARLPAQQAQTSAPAAAQTQAKRAPAGEHMEEPETASEWEQYRHSRVVQAIARFAHVRTETAAQIFEDLNSGVLLFCIGAVLWKFLPKLFRNRTLGLQKELMGARAATEDANRRLAEVEARLMRLDSEIDAIRRQVEKESIEDEKRIHAELEVERQRIVASAEQEIGAAQAAAQRELKRFAADLAIGHAMHRMQLTAETDKALIQEFGKSLNKNSRGEA